MTLPIWPPDVPCSERPEWTDTTDARSVAVALEGCAACPVIDACREWAGTQRHMDAVAGGVLWVDGKPSRRGFAVSRLEQRRMDARSWSARRADLMVRSRVVAMLARGYSEDAVWWQLGAAGLAVARELRSEVAA